MSLSTQVALLAAGAEASWWPGQRRQAASKETALDAVIAGYLCVDFTPRFGDQVRSEPIHELLRPGRLIEVGPLDTEPGGVVANSGSAMAHFGARVALIGLVGLDPIGDLLAGLLADRDVELHLQRVSSSSTAYSVVLAPPGSDRLFLESPGCNAVFDASSIDYGIVARSRIFHFGYPPLMAGLIPDDGVGLRDVFQRAKAVGAATSLDMTVPDPAGPAGEVVWSRLLAGVLPLVDFFVPSVEELLYMLAPGDWAGISGSISDEDFVDAVPADLIEELAIECLRLGASVVLVKAGHRGCFLGSDSVAGLLDTTRLELRPTAWEHARIWLPAFPAQPGNVVNANGAGDAAVAAFLTAVLKGDSPERAGRMAMIAGRDSLYGVDTTSGLRSWQAMSLELADLPA